MGVEGHSCLLGRVIKMLRSMRGGPCKFDHAKGGNLYTNSEIWNTFTIFIPRSPYVAMLLN